MRNYIKLLRVALLVSGATQVNAADDPLNLHAKGFNSATLTGAQVSTVLGGELPEATQLNSLRSRLRAYEESIAPPGSVALGGAGVPLGGYDVADVSMMRTHGHNDAAITLLGTLDNGSPLSKLKSTAVDFTSQGAALATVANYKTAQDALAGVAAVTALKKGNQIYLIKAMSSILAAKDDFTTAVAEAAQGKALTKFVGKFAIITAADSRTAVGKVFAGLVKDLYDAEVTALPVTNANLDSNALNITELQKDSTMTAILAALA